MISLSSDENSQFMVTVLRGAYVPRYADESDSRRNRPGNDNPSGRHWTIDFLDEPPEARSQAQQVIDEDPELEADELSELRHQVVHHYGEGSNWVTLPDDPFKPHAASSHQSANRVLREGLAVKTGHDERDVMA